MVPKVAKRGHSFVACGLYYLHDKADDGDGQKVTTTDRVDWTHVHNVPTDDPEKAMRFMAYTSMNAEQIKHKAGVSKTGRKTTAGSVYSFSLAWHPEQTPEEDHMHDVSMDVLERLGLKDNHQAVIVAHKETEHNHVHVICNLVNMETGKTVSMSNDRLILSKWAQEYELEHGVYCEQRIDNNEQRQKLAYENKDLDKNEPKRKNGMVKHRASKIDKGQIQELYLKASSAEEFKTSLKMAGYTLARGDRRGLVLVNNDTDKVYSLSRQISGLWKKDENKAWKGGLKNRFADFDERALFDVEKTRSLLEKDRQDKATIDRTKQALERKGKTPEKPIEQNKPKIVPIAPAYEKLDREQTINRDLDYLRARQEGTIKGAYDVKADNERLKNLRAKLSKLKKSSPAYVQQIKDIEDLEKTIANQNMRISEVQGKIDKDLEQRRIELEKSQSQDHQEPDNVIDLEAEKNRQLADEFKAAIRKRDQEKKLKRDRDRDKDHGHKL